MCLTLARAVHRLAPFANNPGCHRQGFRQSGSSNTKGTLGCASGPFSALETRQTGWRQVKPFTPHRRRFEVFKKSLPRLKITQAKTVVRHPIFFNCSNKSSRLIRPSSSLARMLKKRGTCLKQSACGKSPFSCLQEIQYVHRHTMHSG